MVFTRILLLTCMVGPILSYELGVKYIYNFKNRIEIKNEDKTPKYEIHSKVSFIVVSENVQNKAEKLLKVELIEPALMIWKNNKMALQSSFLDDSKKANEIYLHRTEDKIDTVYASSNQDQILKNILKSVSNLLKYKSKEELTSESDEKCQVLSTNAEDSEQIQRNCGFTMNLKRKMHYVRSPSLHRTLREEYYINSKTDFTFNAINSVEWIEMSSNLWKNNKVSVKSSIYLKLESEVPGMSESSAKDFNIALKSIRSEMNEESGLPTIIQKPTGDKCDIMKLIKSYKKYLKVENLSKMVSVSAFSKLVKCFRTASTDDIKGVLTAKEFQKILPQVLDVVAVTGTADSLDAAFGTLNFADKDSTHLERYLIALSMNAHPTMDMVKVVLETLKKSDSKKAVFTEETLSTLVGTLGALVKTLASICETPECKTVINQVEETFKRSLETCDTERCRLTYLRGLRNAALESTIPLLMDFAKMGNTEAHEALLALKSLGFHDSSAECEKFSETIFYELQRRQDSSNRILAAEMLLECYSSRSTLKRLAAHLSDQTEHEMSTLLTTTILQKMQVDQKFRSDMLTILQDPDVKQYHALAQKGNSVSFLNPLMPFLASPTGDTNGTYHVRVELLSAGVAKKCSVDININSPESSLHLLSVGAVTNGLESFVSDSGSNPDAVPTAAVDLSILGVSLRPKVLFSGTSHLMGLVFSGAGSEKTPILQGNYLIIDFSEDILLQSGLPVRLMLEGIASNDLSGSIQISLWNRNSQSQIIDSLAVMLRGSLSVNTNFAILEDEFLVKTNTTINILSDSEFYEEPYQMCTQLTHPELILSSQERMLLTIPGHKTFRKSIRKKNWVFPSRSYLLHRKNSNMCAAMNSY